VLTKSKGKNKEGEEIEVLTPVTCGHCSTLQQAFKTLLDNTIKQSDAINNIKQLGDELTQMKADIDKALAFTDVDKLTKEFKVFDNVKFDTDEKDTKSEDEEKPSKSKFDNDDEDKEYDSSECGKSIF